jgi:hypothetical protein
LAERGLLERTTPQPGHPIELSLTAAGYDTLRRTEGTVDRLGGSFLMRCVRPEGMRALDGAFRHVLLRLGVPGSDTPTADGARA